jgi:hypothetical protein
MAGDDHKLGTGVALPSCTGGDTKQEVRQSALKCGNIDIFFFSLFLYIVTAKISS